MGAWWFFTGAWHLTSLSSFIIKEAVNNHLAVDTITSASIIVWRGEAANFLRCHRGDGVWVEGGSNWPRVSRGILNSICQLLPPQCRTAAPGRRPFLLRFRPKETGREAERARLLNVNVKDFDEFTVLAFFVKLKMLTAFDNGAVSGSDLWPVWEAEGKHNDSNGELLRH